MKKVSAFLFMLLLPFILTAQKVPLDNNSYDEAHNLLKRPNKKNISIRKLQFFDHYLKGHAMPYWMKYGIAQTEKGRIDSYNLIK